MNFGWEECWGGVDAVSRLRALAARRVGGPGAPHHTPRSDATKPIQKGAQRRMFCCAPFVLLLRKVWADGVQKAVYGQ